MRIVNHHTDVVLIEKTVPCCWKSRWTPPAPSARSPPEAAAHHPGHRGFARTVDLDDVRDVLERQVNYNMAICEEGLKSSYGGNVGKVLLREFGDGVATRCKGQGRRRVRRPDGRL